MADVPLKLDPTKILQSLESTSTTKKEAVTSGSGGWWATLIVFVVGIVAAVIWWYIDRKNRQELADLRHEKQVSLIKAEQAKTDLIVEGTVIETENLRQERFELMNKMLRINHDIELLEAQRAADKLAIDRIRSWDDLPLGPGPRPGPG